MPTIAISTLLAFLAWSELTPSTPEPIALPAAVQRSVDFEKEVLPILAQKCHQCHGPDKQESGLRLDSRKAALAGGDGGASILPTTSSESPIVHRIAGLDPETIMPPEGEPLSAEQVGILRAWIDQGANWPDHLTGDEGKSKHWSFQAPARPEIPSVRYPGWVRNPIDAFVLKRLESDKVVPSPEADRVTLIRRLTLDLIGLPPTPDEVDAFVRDGSADAYEKVVQRLLASPHYGERWGRYWLDLARYADSDGYEKDLPRPFAWRYRNWVIDALNRDLPFDQFTIEQLAGDLLPESTLEQKVATGFHRNTLKNKEGGVDQEEDRVKIAKDRVNTTGTVWLGLTVGCSECHSHKYDPLSQREYYGFFAFFNNTDDVDIDAPLTQEASEYAAKKKAFDTEHAPFVQALEKFEKEQLATRQTAWEQSLATKPELRGGWHVLDPASAVSLGGATVTEKEDRSLLLGGENPAKDILRIVANTSMKAITGLRLEVLPDESLPEKGPGRSSGGNFVLSELKVEAAPLGDPTLAKSITLKNPKADYFQKGFPIESAIDGKGDTGWAVADKPASMHQRRTAIFEVDGLQGFDAGCTLSFTIDQFHGDSHAIGRLRLAVTSVSPELIPQLVPENIAPLLAIAPEQRTEEQKKELTSYFREIDPEYLTLAKTARQHRKPEPKAPDTKAQTLTGVKEPRKTFVNVRGDFLRPGDEVDAHTPAVLPALAADGAPSRLNLAKWLVSPANPLTARVAVNRYWQHLFGRGIVATENDFGTQGERPSHPELLDWLATELMTRGWSQKAMISLIVSSATYRQSAANRPDLEVLDPKNILLARQNRIRLPAEVVRDLYLASSGLLKPTIGGPSIRPPLPAGVAELGYANSVKWEATKSDDKYRRGLYIFFQRTTPYPMLMTFDAPDSNVSCTRRERSNTPLQALTTLNDPVFYECAQSLGRRVVQEVSGDPKDRIRYAVRLCLARDPSDSELLRLLELYEQLKTFSAKSPDSAAAMIKGFEPAGMDPVEAATWVAMGRTILNLDEFVVRE